MTVGASWLSLIRFNQTDAVMRRVTDGSLPLVRLSLTIETKAGEVVQWASDLAESETAQIQSQRMERVSDQIAELWTMLANLQALGANSETTVQLKNFVNALNEEVRAIDGTTRDFVQTLEQRSAASKRAAGGNGGLSRRTHLCGRVPDGMIEALAGHCRHVR